MFPRFGTRSLLNWHTSVTHTPGAAAAYRASPSRVQPAANRAAQLPEGDLPAGWSLAPREPAAHQRVGARATVGHEHPPVGEVDPALEHGHVDTRRAIELVHQQDHRAGLDAVGVRDATRAHLVAATIILRGPTTAERARALRPSVEPRFSAASLRRQKLNSRYDPSSSALRGLRAGTRRGPWRVRWVHIAPSPGVTPVHSRSCQRAGISCPSVTPSGRSLCVQPSMVRKGRRLRSVRKLAGFVLIVVSPHWGEDTGGGGDLAELSAVGSCAGAGSASTCIVFAHRFAPLCFATPQESTCHRETRCFQRVFLARPERFELPTFGFRRATTTSAG